MKVESYREMKRISYMICLVLVTFFVVNAMAQKEVLLDGLMAKVNDHSITIGDVMLQVQPLQRQLIAEYKGEELRRETKKVFQKSLENLIESKLILDAYKDQQGQIPENVVDGRVNEILHEVFNDDRKAMMRALADDNLTYESWRDNIRNQIIVSSMRHANVQQRLKISSVDVQKYYQEHLEDYKTENSIKVQMIVLKNAVDGTKGEVQKALDLRAQLKNGGDFSAAAKKFSKGYKADDGGDWGWVATGDLREELRVAEAKLKIGEISDVLEVDEDLYILKVSERKTGAIESFADARVGIEGELRNKEGTRLHKEWISSLKRNAQVEVIEIDPFAGN